MKKIGLYLIILFSSPTWANYVDEPYKYESDFKDDVSLLAQSSLLYKQSGESRMYDNTSLLCNGIKAKYRITESKSADMERLIEKVNSICSDY
jgi:hypothetical protein